MRIKANIRAWPDSTYPIVIQPATVAFELQDSLATLEFTMINKGTDPLTPKVVSAPDSLIGITFPGVVPASGSAIGTIELKKAGRTSGFEKSVTIELNDQPKSRFTIPIKRAGMTRAVVPAGSAD